MFVDHGLHELFYNCLWIGGALAIHWLRRWFMRHDVDPIYCRLLALPLGAGSFYWLKLSIHLSVPGHQSLAAFDDSLGWALVAITLVAVIGRWLYHLRSKPKATAG